MDCKWGGVHFDWSFGTKKNETGTLVLQVGICVSQQRAATARCLQHGIGEVGPLHHGTQKLTNMGGPQIPRFEKEPPFSKNSQFLLCLKKSRHVHHQTLTNSSPKKGRTFNRKYIDPNH